jgi:hypothetical protein
VTGCHTALADAALANIRGTTDAQRLLHVCRSGCAPADALQDALQQVVAADEPERLRGFLRHLQKQFERTPS